MAPRLKRERGCGCRNLAKSFIAFFWFYRNFCFPSRFFKQRWSIAFFSCTRVSQVCLKPTCMIEYPHLPSAKRQSPLAHDGHLLGIAGRTLFQRPAPSCIVSPKPSGVMEMVDTWYMVNDQQFAHFFTCFFVISSTVLKNDSWIHGQFLATKKRNRSLCLFVYLFVHIFSIYSYTNYRD